jgi:hypothetical protein
MHETHILRETETSATEVKIKQILSTMYISYVDINILIECTASFRVNPKDEGIVFL